MNKRAEYEKLFSILAPYGYCVFSVVEPVYSRNGGKLSQREIQYTFGEENILYLGTKQEMNLTDGEADPIGLKLDETEGGR